MRTNERDGVIYKQPKTVERRREVASDCRAGMKLSIPMLIDGMDNAVNKAYSGWPDRLYVVAKDGTIAYKGRPGPGGFRPREMEQTLEKMLEE